VGERGKTEKKPLRWLKKSASRLLSPPCAPLAIMRADLQRRLGMALEDLIREQAEEDVSESESYSFEESPNSDVGGAEETGAVEIAVVLSMPSGEPFLQTSGTAAEVANRIRSLSNEIAPLCTLRLIIHNSPYNGADVDGELLCAAWQVGVPSLRISCVLQSIETNQSPYERLRQLTSRTSHGTRAMYPLQTLPALERFLTTERKAAVEDGSWPELCGAAALLFMVEWLPRERAPAEVQDMLRDEAFFHRFVELPGRPGPLLADIHSESRQLFWRNLPPSAQTPRNAEVLLTQIGYDSLPSDVLVAHPQLLRPLVLRGQHGCALHRAGRLLRLELPKDVLVAFLREAEEGLLGHIAEAAVDLATSDFVPDQAAWDRFQEALVADATLEDRCFVLLLRAAREWMRKSTWRPSSYVDMMMMPEHRRAQKMYEAIFGLRVAKKQAEQASRQKSVLTCALIEELSRPPRYTTTGIEIGCALRLFSLTDALIIVRAHVPTSTRAAHWRMAGDSDQDKWLSLLLLYGRMPAQMSSRIAQEAALLLQRPSSSEASLPFPHSRSDEALIGALAKWANYLWAWLRLQADVRESETRWCADTWRNLFEIQAAVAQLIGPLKNKRALIDSEGESLGKRRKEKL
jgi:hypothetical protein